MKASAQDLVHDPNRADLGYFFTSYNAELQEISSKFGTAEPSQITLPIKAASRPPAKAKGPSRHRASHGAAEEAKVKRAAGAGLEENSKEAAAAGGGGGGKRMKEKGGGGARKKQKVSKETQESPALALGVRFYCVGEKPATKRGEGKLGGGANVELDGSTPKQLLKSLPGFPLSGSVHH